MFHSFMCNYHPHSVTFIYYTPDTQSLHGQWVGCQFLIYLDSLWICIGRVNLELPPGKQTNKHQGSDASSPVNSSQKLWEKIVEKMFCRTKDVRENIC